MANNFFNVNVSRACRWEEQSDDKYGGGKRGTENKELGSALLWWLW